MDKFDDTIKTVYLDLKFGTTCNLCVEYGSHGAVVNGLKI